MTAFPALAHGQVRLYLVGQFASMLGSWVLDITLSLLVWHATHSPAMLGVLNFLIYGPAVLVTPLTGARLTMANARRISLTVLAGALGVAASLFVAAALGALPLALLLAAAGVRGILGGMEVPSRQMLLMHITDDVQQRASAIALNTVAFLLARTLGPGLAAVMFEPLGPSWSFALAVCTTAFMLGCVARLRVQPVAAVASAGEGGMRLAWRFVCTDPVGSLMLPIVACVALCVSGYQTLVPVMAARTYGDAAAWTGGFFAAAGAGALVAALLLSSRLNERVIRRWLLAVPWMGAMALAGLAATDVPALAVACFAVLGFCTSFVGTATNTLLHQRVPAAARGGLIGQFLLTFTGAMPVGQLLAGWVAERWSVAATFYLLAVLLALLLLVWCGRRWRRLGRLELDVYKV
jgi:MFS family permease